MEQQVDHAISHETDDRGDDNRECGPDEFVFTGLASAFGSFMQKLS